MDTGATYVIAAYLVVLGVIFAYVMIFSLKVARLEREVKQLARLPTGDMTPASAERQPDAVAE